MNNFVIYIVGIVMMSQFVLKVCDGITGIFGAISIILVFGIIFRLLSEIYEMLHKDKKP